MRARRSLLLSLLAVCTAGAIISAEATCAAEKWLRLRRGYSRELEAWETNDSCILLKGAFMIVYDTCAPITKGCFGRAWILESIEKLGCLLNKNLQRGMEILSRDYRGGSGRKINPEDAWDSLVGLLASQQISNMPELVGEAHSLLDDIGRLVKERRRWLRRMFDVLSQQRSMRDRRYCGSPRYKESRKLQAISELDMTPEQWELLASEVDSLLAFFKRDPLPEIKDREVESILAWQREGAAALSSLK